MFLLKNWKTLTLALSFMMLVACAGSSGGGSSSEDYDSGAGPAGAGGGKKKEVIDENKLKKNEQEAMALTEENHKLRREIFETKNKLGMPTEQPAEDAQ